MSKTNFTPGKWKANGIGGVGDFGSTSLHAAFVGTITAENGTRIIERASFVPIGGSTPKEAEANAYLIAAAPELYDGLLAAVRTIDRLNDELASYDGWGDRNWDSVDSECIAYKGTLAKARGEQQ